ncbi:MAG TPA: L-threonylcarbamoyladenylate synthase [Acidimicrobiales bacterium]|nr:L-threonylcarbamoyladenylate synthase [Acidimicrobiales bacterium]
MSAPELGEAIQALRDGAVVGIPTDTVYGLAVDPRSADASGRVFAVKGRPDSVALPVLAASGVQALRLAAPVPDWLDALLQEWWPGPLTVVLPRSEASAAFALGGDQATIGLRCPAHPFTLALLRAIGPLAVTSANRHGEDPLTTAAAVAEAFPGGVGVVLDGGRCAGRPSTVVGWPGSGERLQMLREGAVTVSDLAPWVTR